MTQGKWRAVVLSATLVSLAAGLVMKSPCLYRNWGPPEYIQYRSLCYSDLQPLYGLRGLDQRRIPYVEEKSYEYPALIGLEMWIASYASNSHVSFFIANVPILAVSALVASWALFEAMRNRPKRVLVFALAPPLAFYSFHNWDLLAIAPLALCVWAWSRGRQTQAGAFAGLGAAAKLFPAYGLPALGVSLLGTRGSEGKADRLALRLRRAKGLVLGAAGAWSVVNIPLIVIEALRDGSIDGWTGVFAFHARRFPDFGTVWYWWPEWVTATGNRGLAAILLPALVWAAAGAMLSAYALGLYRAGRATGLTPAAVGTVVVGGLVIVLALGRSSVIAGGPTSDSYKRLVDVASLCIFGLGSAALIFHQWRRRTGPWTTFAGILSLFLLVSKVHSPQYALWMLVFFVVVETPGALIAAYFAADAVLLTSGFWWFADSPSLGPSVWRSVFVVSVLARALVLGALLVWYATGARDLVGFGEASSPVDLEMEMAAGSPRSS